MNNKSIRDNKGKLKWSLVHFKSLFGLVRVLEHGAEEYGIDNWKIDLDKKEILESLIRHATAIMDGDEIDEDSKLPHIDHVMANAMFYSFYRDKK